MLSASSGTLSSPRASLRGLERIGPFFVDARATPEHHLQRLVEIAPWFTAGRIESYLIPMITQRSSVSLRALDWFVTNYCKGSPILVRGADGYHCVSTLYKLWLRQWRRQLFDPFRRRARVFFITGGEERHLHETTCAQLNFLYWAEAQGVLRQAELRIADVERDMLSALKRSREERASRGSKRRRTVLTPEPGERCQVFLMDAPLRLDLSPPSGRAAPEPPER